jgi:DNA-damage-inducible protein J
MNSVVKARVENDLKVRSETIFAELGLDMTSAIKIFLRQVVMRQALPFDVKVIEPNAITLKAIEDSYAGRVHSAASVDALFDEASR